MALAHSRTARHRRIVELLDNLPVRSQSELLGLLAKDGVAITQATLSRDLVELGAVKVRRGRTLVYAVPAEGGDMTPRPALDPDEIDARLRRLCEEVLVTAARARNLVVLRTPPGAANYLASAIDRSAVWLAGRIVGTVAGDDTVLVIAADDTGAEQVERALLDMAARNDPLGAGRADRPETDSEGSAIPTVVESAGLASGWGPGSAAVRDTPALAEAREEARTDALGGVDAPVAAPPADGGR